MKVQREVGLALRGLMELLWWRLDSLTRWTVELTSCESAYKSPPAFDLYL